MSAGSVLPGADAAQPFGTTHVKVTCRLSEVHASARHDRTSGSMILDRAGGGLQPRPAPVVT
ncbi:MAG: hypothetical protein M3545_08215, partial [Acidobacteriota bacterium]|nr:hypothetical protein [Acidobacteriota bacterium]